ncbi:MAG: hypothetical protein KY433_08005 [Actinobacteria bacterium]|nr:hypothetical protein [Actinomycetota bacterium]
MDRSPAPRIRSESGQTSAEYIGMILVIVAIIGAIAVSGIGGAISQGIERAVCQVSGGACEAARDSTATEACLLSESTRSATIGAGVTVRVFGGEGEAGSVVVRQDRSDDSGTITIVDKASLAATASLPRGRGGSFSAEAALGLALEAGHTFDFADLEEAKRIEDAIAASGGFAGIARNAADIADGVADFLVPFVDPPDLANGAQDLVGIPKDELPRPPDSRYIDVQSFLDGTIGFDRGVGTTTADAELEAILKRAQGGRLHTSGAREGQLDLYYRLEGSASGELANVVFGGRLAGDAEGVGTLTIDTRDGFRPLEFKVEASAAYDGELVLGPSIDGDDIPALRRTLDGARMRQSESSGKKIRFTGILDLAGQQDVNATLAGLLLPGPGKIPSMIDLTRRLNDDGTLSIETLDTSSSSTERELDLALVEGHANDERTVSRVRSTLVRKPGEIFEEPRCARA